MAHSTGEGALFVRPARRKNSTVKTAGPGSSDEARPALHHRRRRSSGHSSALPEQLSALSIASDDEGDEKERCEEDGYETEEEDNQPPAGTVLATPVPVYELDIFPSSGKPRVLVLFAGAGFSSVGLALAGYEITAVEIDPRKCHMHSFMKPAAKHVICADVRTLTPEFLRSFKTMWLSPPCQQRSVMRVSSQKSGAAHNRGIDFVNWSLENTRHCDVVWIENVYNTNTIAKEGGWGVEVNSAQFTPIPLQCRQRLIGGKYPLPRVFRKPHRSYRRVRGIRFEPVYKRGDYRPDLADRPESSRYNEKLEYKAVVVASKREGRLLGIEPELCGVCPTLTSSEVKCPMKQHPDRQNPFVAYRQYGSRYYNCVRVRLDPMAMHMGLPAGMPEEWRKCPMDHPEWEKTDNIAHWHENLYEGVGNGVPVYMVFAFAQAALYATLDKSYHKYLQLDSPFVPSDKPFPTQWVDTTNKTALQYQ